MTSGAEAPPGAVPPSRPFPRWIFGLALVCCALVTGWTVMSVLAHVTPALFPSRSLPGIDELNALLPPPLDIDEPDEGTGFRRRQNLLIIGLDARPGLELLDLWRTDMIMVATIDPNANVAAILSFPRDLLIDIHDRDPQVGVYQDRINVSYQRGVLYENSFAGGRNSWPWTSTSTSASRSTTGSCSTSRRSGSWWTLSGGCMSISRPRWWCPNGSTATTTRMPT